MKSVGPRKKSSWVYLLPVLHLSACLISMVGYLIPSLQYMGIVWACHADRSPDFFNRIRPSMALLHGRLDLDHCRRYVVVVFSESGHREIDQQEQDHSWHIDCGKVIAI